MIENFEQFLEFYEKYGKTPNMLSVPKNKLNLIQLQSKWKSYSKAIDKKMNKTYKGSYDDPLWADVVEKVIERDKNVCRFLTILSKDDILYMNQHYPHSVLKILDPAHVFARTKSHNLYYCTDNIYQINRVSHGFLDTYKHPITGKPISREERKNWWIKIIGQEIYEELERRS